MAIGANESFGMCRVCEVMICDNIRYQTPCVSAILFTLTFKA